MRPGAKESWHARQKRLHATGVEWPPPPSWEQYNAALLDAATWALEATEWSIGEASVWRLTREQWRGYVATIARLAPDTRVGVPCPGDDCTLTGHEAARDALAWRCFDHRGMT